ncbi:MAG: sulfoxide reductase heme-binding subunit YedZ [Betaproteobacteria bacterium]|nr:sulfoxide reductase heme-binding subunit YedZ [Betaproteobacteria bacterium]
MQWRLALLSPWAKPMLSLVLALPMLGLGYAAWHDLLGANPAEALSRSTGDWTLRGLCLVLAVTPLRVALKAPGLLRLRRTIGVATFVYACLHLLCYAWFDQGLEWDEIWRDMLKRPFIWLGMSAWLLMLPLALTSSNRAVKALGGRRWQMLHRLVYATALLSVLHFFWMRAGKNNFAEVWVYAALLSGLMVWRLWWWRRA